MMQVSAPSLQQGEVHVWTARVVDDIEVTAEFAGILDHVEHAKAARFSYERHRARFIQFHGILRRILNGYTGIAAAELIFVIGRHGKPTLTRIRECTDVHFSLSHSGDCCMIAVRRGYPIGVDLEEVREFPQATNIARKHFALAEGRLLKSLKGASQRDVFFALWTHKEAVAKALGASLAATLDRIEFEFDPLGYPRLISLDGNRTDLDQWFIQRQQPSSGYVGAVASPHACLKVIPRVWNEIGHAGSRATPSRARVDADRAPIGT